MKPSLELAFLIETPPSDELGETMFRILVALSEPELTRALLDGFGRSGLEGARDAYFRHVLGTDRIDQL